MSENIIEVPALDAVQGQYSVYGEYVNLHRHIPYVFDGLKPSYRRVIQAAFDVARDKFAKTATIVGRTIGAYHPHGDQSVSPIVSELVLAGIFKGKGNHGSEQLVGDDLPPAASRYTEARISDNYKALLNPILGEIPTYINEFNNNEFIYIPTPIPLGLLFGYLGIGIGTGVKIPAFTAESLLDAYLNNDYRLLKNNKGVEIINFEPTTSINELGEEVLSPSKVEDLWHVGGGRINYRLHIEEENGVIRIVGSKGPLRLDWSWLFEMRDQGRVEINELTAGTPIVEISKAPRVQYPSYEEIYQHVIRMVTGGESYYFRVVYNDQVRDIGLYDWIDITYKNYKKLYQNSLNKQIDHCKHEIEIYSHFNEVGDLILNRRELTYEQISEKLNVSIDIVKAIGAKSLNTLRTIDPNNKINSLENKIKELSNFNIDELIKSNISLM